MFTPRLAFVLLVAFVGLNRLIQANDVVVIYHDVIGDRICQGWPTDGAPLSENRLDLFCRGEQPGTLILAVPYGLSVEQWEFYE